MKIIHTADWHLGKNLEGHSRLPEQKKFLEDFVGICEKEQADLILIAGDIYDNYNPSAQAEQLFYDTLKRLSGGGRRMTVVISGNHDNPDRLTAPGPLARDHGIVMAGTPNVLIPTGDYGKNRIVESEPGYIRAIIGGEAADILLIPFPSEKRLGELYIDSMDKERQQAQSYEQRMRLLLTDLAQQFGPDAVHLIISHLFVMGTEGDGSERSVSLGGSTILPANIFPASADYVALGHVHKPQRVPGRDTIRYSGSPLHYNQREVSFPNQVLSVKLHPGQKAEIRPLSLPIYKPIEIWHCDSPAEAVERCRIHGDEDSWVFMEVRTDHYIHEEDIKEMKRLKADILSIRPIFTEEDGTQSAPDKPEDVPFEVLVQDFYRRKFQTEMEQETLDLLLSILNKPEKEEAEPYETTGINAAGHQQLQKETDH